MPVNIRRLRSSFCRRNSSKRRSTCSGMPRRRYGVSSRIIWSVSRVRGVLKRSLGIREQEIRPSGRYNPPGWQVSQKQLRPALLRRPAPGRKWGGQIGSCRGKRRTDTPSVVAHRRSSAKAPRPPKPTLGKTASGSASYCNQRLAAPDIRNIIGSERWSLGAARRPEAPLWKRDAGPVVDRILSWFFSVLTWGLCLWCDAVPEASRWWNCWWSSPSLVF